MIFMGWPGQHELEDDRAAHRSQNADGVTGSGEHHYEEFHTLSFLSLLLHVWDPHAGQMGSHCISTL